MSTPAPTYGPVQTLVVVPATDFSVSATWDAPAEGEPTNGGSTGEQAIGVSTAGNALYAQMTQQLTPTITALVTAVEAYSPYGGVRWGYSASQPTSQAAITWLGYVDLPASPAAVRGTLSTPVPLTAGVPIWVVGHSVSGGYVRADTGASLATFEHCTVANSRVNYNFDYNPGSASVAALRGIAAGTLAAYEVSVLAGTTLVSQQNLLAGVHTVTFTHLPGGDYTLRVRSLQPDAADPADVLQDFTIVTPAVVAGATAHLESGSMDGLVEAFQIDRTDDRLTLTLLTATIRQPGVLKATLGNGVPDSPYYLFLDDEQVQSGVVDASGTLSPLNIAVSGLSAGSHTASVGATPVAPAVSVPFITLNGRIVITDLPLTPEPPAAVPPGRWAFQTYDLDEFGRSRFYVLATNPGTVKRVYRDTLITTEPNAFGGGVASWEGQATPDVWNWTGHVYTQEQYAEMAFWGQSTQRLYVTDHFGDRYLVKVSQYETTRVRDMERPWHHTFGMVVWVLTGALNRVLPDVRGWPAENLLASQRGVAAGGIGGPAAVTGLLAQAAEGVAGGVGGGVAVAATAAAAAPAGEIAVPASVSGAVAELALTAPEGATS